MRGLINMSLLGPMTGCVGHRLGSRGNPSLHSDVHLPLTLHGAAGGEEGVWVSPQTPESPTGSAAPRPNVGVAKEPLPMGLPALAAGQHRHQHRTGRTQPLMGEPRFFHTEHITWHHF